MPRRTKFETMTHEQQLTFNELYGVLQDTYDAFQDARDFLKKGSEERLLVIDPSHYPDACKRMQTHDLTFEQAYDFWVLSTDDSRAKYAEDNAESNLDNAINKLEEFGMQINQIDFVKTMIDKWLTSGN